MLHLKNQEYWLRAYDIPTLARWEAEFNQYEWPTDFPIDAPQEREEMRSAGHTYWKTIANLGVVPFKEFLRAHNTIVNQYMTDEEFEEWWAARGCADFRR